MAGFRAVKDDLSVCVDVAHGDGVGIASIANRSKSACFRVKADLSLGGGIGTVGLNIAPE